MSWAQLNWWIWGTRDGRGGYVLSVTSTKEAKRPVSQSVARSVAPIHSINVTFNRMAWRWWPVSWLSKQRHAQQYHYYVPSFSRPVPSRPSIDFVPNGPKSQDSLSNFLSKDCRFRLNPNLWVALFNQQFSIKSQNDDDNRNTFNSLLIETHQRQGRAGQSRRRGEYKKNQPRSTELCSWQRARERERKPANTFDRILLLESRWESSRTQSVRLFVCPFVQANVRLYVRVYWLDSHGHVTKAPSNSCVKIESKGIRGLRITKRERGRALTWNHKKMLIINRLCHKQCSTAQLLQTRKENWNWKQMTGRHWTGRDDPTALGMTDWSLRLCGARRSAIDFTPHQATLNDTYIHAYTIGVCVRQSANRAEILNKTNVFSFFSSNK